MQINSSKKLRINKGNSITTKNIEMKTKKILTPFILAVLLVGCGQADYKSQLTRLEAKKTKLQNDLNATNQEIDELKKLHSGDTQEKAVPIYTSQLSKTTFMDYFTVQGDVNSDNNINVPAEFSGVIRKVLKDEGQYVTKGTLLAEIDNSLVLKQKEELLTSLELANTNYERQSRLWEQKIGSEMQYLQAKNQKEGLDKKLETLNEQLSKTNIFAPIDGTIDEVFLKEGEIIQTGMPSFRIVQLSKLKIKAEVSEQYVASVNLTDSVLVQFEEINEEFKAKIQAISQVIDPDNRTFTIEIAIPESLKNVKPTMYGQITIFNYINSDAIKIPINIILKNEQGEFIFVAKESEGKLIAERRHITVKNTNPDYAEIVDGLEEGDMLITDGYQNLSNKQSVEIISQQ